MRIKFPSETFLVELDELHPDGYGLGEFEGRKIAIHGVLPGEVVRCQVYTKRKKLLFARPVEIVKASQHRVTPLCKFSDDCGGCGLHHLDPDQQIANKQKKLLEELGSNQPKVVLEPIQGPISGYRRKARLGVKFVEKKGKVLVGFRDKTGKYICEADRCVVLHEQAGNHLTLLAELVQSLDVYKLIPQIEVAVGDDSAAFVIRHLVAFSAADLHLLSEFESSQGVEIYLQPGGLDSVRRLTPSTDTDRLHYRIPAFNIEMAFHPLDFTQVNHEINLRLINLAVQLLNPKATDSILDLFCGIGNFSLPLALHCKHVIGIEGSLASVQRARENALLNDISNTSFCHEDLILESDSAAWESSIFNKVLIDPPRSGAMEVVKKLADSPVSHILYISCNPVSLARDASVLVESGFSFSRAGVVDMFPHTSHVESVALFER